MPIKIDWNSLKKSDQTISQMLAAIYAKYGTLINASNYLGVAAGTLASAMKKYGVPRNLKGWKHPTKLDNFMKIPSEKLRVMHNDELGKIFSMSSKAITVYRNIRRKRENDKSEI